LKSFVSTPQIIVVNMFPVFLPYSAIQKRCVSIAVEVRKAQPDGEAQPDTTI
jgi:hypothetical protein